MSHRHYWAKNDNQGAPLAGSRQLHVDVGRNAEKLSVIVPNGSSLSGLGGPGERDFGEYAK